jgi:Kef-type K+ transport system membrane component KefB
MDEAHSFAPLLVVVMLASLMPLLLSSVLGRLAIPIVVGEIVAGMIVGRSGFGWVLPDDGALNLLKELGFAYLKSLPPVKNEVPLPLLPSVPKARPTTN